MARNDGNFDDEDELSEDAPTEIKSFTLLAIDHNVEPVAWCPKGHIIEWRNKESGVSVSYLRLVNTDMMSTTVLCIVCGLPAATTPEDQEPPDAESESTD